MTDHQDSYFNRRTLSQNGTTADPPADTACTATAPHADRTAEARQLAEALVRLGYAQAVLNDPEAGEFELRYLMSRLIEALRDAIRVADARGARLGLPKSASGFEERYGFAPPEITPTIGSAAGPLWPRHERTADE